MTTIKRANLSIVLILALATLFSAHAQEPESDAVDISTVVSTNTSTDENTSEDELGALNTTESEADAVVAEGEEVAKRVKASTEKSDLKQDERKISHKEQLMELRNAFDTAGIAAMGLSADQAESLITEANAKAAREISKEGNEELDERVVRVPYVPTVVLDDIRDQVSAGVRTKVVEDVMQQAKTERWGLPDALPSWVSKVKWKGDIRVRAQNDSFAEDNAPLAYRDFNVINKAGGFNLAGIDRIINTTENRTRLRNRARLEMDAKPTNNVLVGMRITTGNITDPVSTNQTLGNYGARTYVVWDRAYLGYTSLDEDMQPWLTLNFGRMPNPWLSTDLVWDSDLGFEGIAATYRYNLYGSNSLLDISSDDKTFYFTLGAFPLQEVELSPHDKWLLGAQLRTDFEVPNQPIVRLGLAYYDFKNIAGRMNELNLNLTDYTAPEYMQKGNTLFNINNDGNADTDLWALASDFKLINLTASIDLANWAPLHLIMDFDYVKNIGYDREAIIARTGGVYRRSGGTRLGVDPFEAKTTGYQIKTTFGWPVVSMYRSWDAFFAYKHLERDAVVDAFTDSDFHLGGTDAKGWLIGADYAIETDTVVSFKYFSSNSIDAAPLSVDTLQLDISAKF